LCQRQKENAFVLKPIILKWFYYLIHGELSNMVKYSYALELFCQNKAPRKGYNKDVIDFLGIM